MQKKQLLLASPRGFCAGVERAILIVERVLEHFDETVYVRHEIVHNHYVVNDLRSRGVVFIDELDEVPDGAIVIFSAHGVSNDVEEEAKKRKLRIFDSTCPLVSKVHIEVTKISANGDDCILIGHKNHPEVAGTMGRFDLSKGGTIYLVENQEQAQKILIKQPDRLHLVSQTTLSIDDTSAIADIIKMRFPSIKAGYKDICYATQNRQNAVKGLVKKVEVLFVVGSANSSNSSRLQEIAKNSGIDSYLVDDPDEVTATMLNEKNTIGLTAGASAPARLVDRIIDKLKQIGCDAPISNESGRENVTFALPESIKVLNLDTANG